MARFAGIAAWLAVVLLPAASLAAEETDASETPQNFILRETLVAVSELEFKDADGRRRTIADFRGKVVLLNVWATWCVPCREEMPALDRLQARLGGADFEVVAVSIDRSGVEAVRKFHEQIAIKNLALYVDDTGKANRTLGLLGLPSTLLIDRNGFEVGRLMGPAEWDAPEMIAFIQRRLGPPVTTEELQ